MDQLWHSLEIALASQKKDALEAYNKFLSKETITWSNTTVKSDELSFSTYDIDHDGIPELILKDDHISHAAGNTRGYYYELGKVKEIDIYNLIGSYYEVWIRWSLTKVWERFEVDPLSGQVIGYAPYFSPDLELSEGEFISQDEHFDARQYLN